MTRMTSAVLIALLVTQAVNAAPGDVSLTRPTVACPQTQLGDDALQSKYTEIWRTYEERVAAATKAVEDELTSLFEDAKAKGNLDLALFWKGLSDSLDKTGEVCWEPTNQKKTWNRFGSAKFPDGLTLVINRSRDLLAAAREGLGDGYKELEVLLTKDDALDKALSIRKEHQDLWATSKSHSSEATSPSKEAQAPKAPVVSRIMQLRQRAAGDAVQIGKHFYKVFPGKVAWHDAKRACEEMGGYLACLESPDEQNRVAELKGRGRVVWVGGYRNDRGQFLWLNGQPLDASRVRVDDPGFRFVGFTVENGLNVRPVSGTVDYFTIRDIQGYVCEWDE
jgi:hypothetical protein